MCFGPNSSLLATGGADHLIHLWNIVGGKGSPTSSPHPTTGPSVLSLQTLGSLVPLGAMGLDPEFLCWHCAQLWWLGRQASQQNWTSQNLDSRLRVLSYVICKGLGWGVTTCSFWLAWPHLGCSF